MQRTQSPSRRPIESGPELIATVPLELGNVFRRYGIVRMLDPPVPLPPFALNQHWHARFHHDPAIIWLRDLMKRTFENYPNLALDDRTTKVASRPRGGRASS
ncbi:MAG TPA: hypothetical protein VFR86_28275 [Burkholderiaceae bacterium]|nr:hypothetical protein [Burkholderiaceae bacterium]